MKQLIVFCFFVALFCPLIPSYAQLDPAAPPTDDLEFEEVQKMIEKMLPHTPDLLVFKTICKFPFGDWPSGISDSGAQFQEAFKGYSLKSDNNLVLFLDKEGHSIFAIDPLHNRLELLASDFPKKNIQFADFCRLRDKRMVIADNSRNALLFFSENQFLRNVGFDGERILFRHIDFVEADRLGFNLIAYDSGRDRSYVFDRDGNLKWETDGRCEPCFLGNSLIKIRKEETRIQLQRLSEINRVAQTFATYSCQPDNIILDAWVAGTFAGKLAVVVYEGRGDEDHPDYARLLMIKDSVVEIFKFRPNLDFRLSLQSPYRLLVNRTGMQLITARIADGGIEIHAAAIK